MGGGSEATSYKAVSSGKTQHIEVVQLQFDPRFVSYKKLLEKFWTSIDPTVKDRQFCDRGRQYRSEIFFHSKKQEELARSSKSILEKSKRFPKIETIISAASTFHKAEEYHQDFYLKKPSHYKRYRIGCRRDQRLSELWSGFGGIFK